MTMERFVGRRTRLALVAAGWAACAAVASAQTTQPQGDRRWAAWYGCWTPTDAQSRLHDVQVCVVPTDDRAGVRMMTFAGDQLVLDEAIVADGAPHAVADAGCRGTRLARWASQGIRLLISTELSCDGQPTHRATGISTLTTANHWIDIQATGPDGREGVRTRQYAQSTMAPPASIAPTLRALPSPAPVMAVAITAEDVIEAHGAVSPRAVEAWLVETEPRVALDRRALVSMKAKGVNEPVIDLLVALAYPSRFEVHRSAASGATIATAGGGGFFDGVLSSSGPWGLAYDPYSLYYSPMAAWYLESMYSYYLPGSGIYVTLPTEVGATSPSIHGRVVNGQGYTRVEPREARPANNNGGGGSSTTSSAPFSSGDASSGGSAGGSSGASPAGYSSGGGGGGGGGGATAVPR